MKRLLFAFILIALTASLVSAQQNEAQQNEAQQNEAQQNEAQQNETQQNGAVFAVVGEATHDFKTIKEADGAATHTFTIKNEGKAPLEIKSVTTTCSCTTSEFSKEPIAPGETEKLKVTYDTANRTGPFTRTIQVYSNGSSGSYILTIKGTVEGK